MCQCRLNSPAGRRGMRTEHRRCRLDFSKLHLTPANHVKASVISIDSITGELGGDALCQLIERPVVDVRILGRSESIRVKARGTTLFATGNNFVIVGDACGRSITTNLDAGVERPELRRFDFDPVDRILEDRGKYIAAALTICRAYLVAGRPNRAPKLGSFEGWRDTVRFCADLAWQSRPR
jgi:phage gp37-like protein